MSVWIDLSSDIALVTGAGGGIGEGIATQLAAAGARVVVADPSLEAAHTVAEQITNKGGIALSVEMDVSDPTVVHGSLGIVHDRFGPISVLVNNVASIGTSTDAGTDSDARQVVDIALMGTIRVTRAALPDLLATRGAIVNVVSDVARTGQDSMTTAAPAQAGVLVATKGIAREAGHAGVRANVVTAGTMITPGHESVLDRPGGAGTTARTQALGRFGTPADVAGAVLFLASPMAGWITGQVLPVNGGHLAS